MSAIWNWESIGMLYFLEAVFKKKKAEVFFFIIVIQLVAICHP